MKDFYALCLPIKLINQCNNLAINSVCWADNNLYLIHNFFHPLLLTFLQLCHRLHYNYTMHTKCYLRNGKHVQSFHRVIETRVEEFGRMRNAVGTRAIGEHFHTFFKFSQTFVGVILYSIETQRTCFLFLLENAAMEKRETTRLNLLWSSKCKLSTAHTSLVFLSSYRNTVKNQSECVPS